MLLNSHILAYARCLAGNVCGLMRSTWGTSLGEDKPGARDKILNTKVTRRANIPPQFVVSARSIIVLNVLMPTLVGITLFVRHMRSDMH